jgi:hypothetical protein
MFRKESPMALKIVYKICCGIDVHKSFIVACIASTNSMGGHYLQEPSLFNLHERFERAVTMAY